MMIPLFPLHTVLFPGMPISLHIFEERYKQMITHCLEHHQPFGVVLIDKGDEANGALAVPCSVGCTAQITQVQKLAEGRMNILATGNERFEIQTLSDQLPYLTGSVQMLPIQHVSTKATLTADTLRPWMKRYLRTLAEVDNLDIELTTLPQEPLALGYLAAFLLQITAQEKQILLEHSSTEGLLDELLMLYRREVTLTRALHRQRDQHVSTPFSQN